MNTLIIEDNRATRTLLKSYLRQFDPTGHIHEASTAQDAFSKLRTIEFIDIITFDHDTGLNGLNLIPKIHELKPNSQIVMITGDRSTELKQQALKHHIELIYKPFDSIKLKKLFTA